MKKLLTALLLAAFVAFPSTAQAQMADDGGSAFRIGPRAGFDLETEGLVLGVDTRYDLSEMPITINVNGNYHFGDYGADLSGSDVSWTIISINANALYEFGIDNQAFTPYAGGGLNIGYSNVSYETAFASVDDSDTDVTLNIAGGAYFHYGSLSPFAQVDLALGGGEFITLAGGILFNL